MIKPGDKFYDRIDGTEYIVSRLFREPDFDEKMVEFENGYCQTLYCVKETSLYMSEEEWNTCKQFTQPWDDADLVPNP